MEGSTTGPFCRSFCAYRLGMGSMAIVSKVSARFLSALANRTAAATPRLKWGKISERTYECNTSSEFLYQARVTLLKKADTKWTAQYQACGGYTTIKAGFDTAEEAMVVAEEYCRDAIENELARWK